MHSIKAILAHACLAASLCVATSAHAVMANRGTASPLERTYAERVAMGAIAERCDLLKEGPQRALLGFTAQARGAVLRAGVDDQRVNLITQQAKAASAQKSCRDVAIVGEAHRIERAHQSWRGQMSASYPGLVRTWVVDRSGKDAWRAVQDLGQGVRAGFVRTRTGLAFAIETPDTRGVSARLLLRDISRLPPPKAGTRLAPPMRAGTKAYLAAAKQPANTRQRVELPPRAGALFAFADATTRAVLNADPRDSFEIEILSPSGQSTSFVVEVGDIAAAWAFAAEP
jgi:hypothetical protein